MATKIAANSRVEAPSDERRVWTVFLDTEGTDAQVEVFASEVGAHRRASSLAGTSSGLHQADRSICYQDGAGNFYTVRQTIVQD
jgi:hypothetical protein